MRRRVSLLIAPVLLSMAACASGPSQAPETFALEVAKTVARGDWEAYRPLALARAAALATDSNPTASRGTFANLVDADEDRIHADFDRVARSGVVRTQELDGYRGVVDATEPDRWHLHIEDGAGVPTGLCMTLLRFNESYRVVHLYTRR